MLQRDEWVQNQTQKNYCFIQLSAWRSQYSQARRCNEGGGQSAGKVWKDAGRNDSKIEE